MALRYHRRPLTARNIQATDDHIRALARSNNPQLHSDLMGALHGLRDLVPRDKIIEEISHGRYRSAVNAIPLGQLRHAFHKPFDTIANIFEAGAKIGADRITQAFVARGKRIRYFEKIEMPIDAILRGLRDHRRDLSAIAKETLRDRFTFNRFEPDTVATIRQYQDNLIAQLSDDARNNIERAVMSGVQAARSPTQIANSIRDSISLTGTQAQAVSNYRRLIEDLDPQALSRQLRDSGYDAQLQDAIDSGEFLDSGTIDAMVSDYADNYLDYRAATIAGTESTRAANLGLHEAYSQAIDRGSLPSEAVKRVWLVAQDERTCAICSSIPDMNPDGVDIDSEFQSIDGPQDDPPVHPSCRCGVQYETNLDLVPDE